MSDSQTTTVIRFSVDGKARPKGRPRSTSKDGVRRHYTPKTTADYEDKVRKAAVAALGMAACFNCPVSVSINVRCAPPRRVSKAVRAEMLAGRMMPTSRPDLDNIQKVVADALNGFVIRDDADIVNLSGSKRYAAEPGIDVIVESAVIAGASGQPVMDALDVVAEVSWRGREAISPDMVRCVLHLLSEVIQEETDLGRRVEVEMLGVFSQTPGGDLAFEDGGNRKRPSVERAIHWRPEDFEGAPRS